MILAIASGKGGTGKTTVALNLARVFQSPVQLLDCDVEEPNTHLFLKAKLLSRETVGVLVPKLDESLCNSCGECSKFCAYNAIASLKGNKAVIFPELCHSCGGCIIVCPQKALHEENRPIGVVETLLSENITLIVGKLNVGESMAPPLIKEVKARLKKNTLAILDAPPGTSCPVVTTVRGADFVLLVAEDTPFGLHDLILSVEMLRQIGLPFAIVANRVRPENTLVETFCKNEKIPLLLKIPDDRRVAEAYSRGELLVDVLPEYRGLFESLLNSVINWESL